MSAFVPATPGHRGPERDHPRLHQEPTSPAERRARWEVRAAQWRACELAEHVFGSVSAMSLAGIREDGPMRGLLRLDVPFGELGTHREREARFMAAVSNDPILGHVPLVYVIGPDAA